jgi:hypothetical protein
LTGTQPNKRSKSAQTRGREKSAAAGCPGAGDARTLNLDPHLGLAHVGCRLSFTHDRPRKAGMERWRLFQDVCEILEMAGFQPKDGDTGVIVRWESEGVRVGWRPDLSLLRPAIRLGKITAEHGAYEEYAAGIRHAMTTALSAVLEQAECAITRDAGDLLVTECRLCLGSEALG